MYKIEEFVGTAAELEKFLNEMQVINYLIQYLDKLKLLQDLDAQLIEPFIPQYFMGMTKKRQIYLEYAKENLCKDCLTCADFGYYCRGNKERCNAWKYDEKAHYRIDKVV